MANLWDTITADSKEYRKNHLVPSGYSDLDLLGLANWQATVYGNRTTKEIMEAYNDSKLQYAM